MQIVVLTPEKKMFEGEAEVITLPTPGGEISVLSHHDSLVSVISSGIIRIKDGKETKEIVSDGGVIETARNKATILLRRYRVR